MAAFLVMLSASFMDNMRGPFIPIIAHALGITYGDAGMFLVVGQVVSSLSAIPLYAVLRLSGARSATIGLLLIGIAAAAMAGLVTSYSGLLLLAAPVGLVVGSGGTLANIVLIRSTPVHLRGKFLTGLHAMYGIGSVASPFAVSSLIAAGFAWPSFFMSTIPLAVLAVLASWMFIPAGSKPEQVKDRPTSRHWWVKAFITILFCFYVGGEVLMSGWLAAWLVAARNLSVQSAANYVMGFFLVLAAIRMTCFAVLQERYERMLLMAVLLIGMVANVMGQAIDPRFLMAAGILGPFFPVLLARVSRLFPDEWQEITILLGLVVPAVIGLFHFVLSKMADQWGLATAYTFPVILQAIALVMTGLYLMLENKWKEH